MSSRPLTIPVKRAKAKRVTKACDFCHSRSIRCRLDEHDELKRCRSCIDYGQPCTFGRPSRKRGVSSGTRNFSGTPPSQHTPPSLSRLVVTDNSDHWTSPSIADQATVMDLVDIYFEVVYPVFPFFHRPSLHRQVARAEFQTDRPLFAAVMALCSLSAARLRDGAVTSKHWDIQKLTRVTPDKFFAAAEDAIPKEPVAFRNLRYLQSAALLSIAALQIGNIHTLHFYSGIYHMFCRVESLHSEVNWPKGIGQVETEERRRLFWSMYTLDIFSAAVFGTIPNCREAHTRVAYPSEVEDELIRNELGHSAPLVQESPTFTSPLKSDKVHWLRGWNFTTDLYRILEHAVERLQSQYASENQSPRILFNANPSEASIIDYVMDQYKELPYEFKRIPVMESDATNRYGFQSANIAATMQLVRMTLFSTKEASTQEKCAIVSELLEAFVGVPSAYLRGLSTPLLYHLAGIGTVLGPVFEGPMTATMYNEVRTLLLSLADLLTSMETGMVTLGGASRRLRSHIQRMDEHMHQRRQQPITSNHNSISPPQQQQLLSSVSSLTAPTSYNERSATQQNYSPEFVFPVDVVEDWSWAFDFPQATR